jgi:hypothetical protein
MIHNCQILFKGNEYIPCMPESLWIGPEGEKKGISGVSGNATGTPNPLLFFSLKDPVTG